MTGYGEIGWFEYFPAIMIVLFKVKVTMVSKSYNPQKERCSQHLISPE